MVVALSDGKELTIFICEIYESICENKFELDGHDICFPIQWAVIKDLAKSGQPSPLLEHLLMHSVLIYYSNVLLCDEVSLVVIA